MIYLEVQIIFIHHDYCRSSKYEVYILGRCALSGVLLLSSLYVYTSQAFLSKLLSDEHAWQTLLPIYTAEVPVFDSYFLKANQGVLGSKSVGLDLTPTEMILGLLEHLSNSKTRTSGKISNPDSQQLICCLKSSIGNKNKFRNKSRVPTHCIFRRVEYASHTGLVLLGKDAS